MVIYGLTDFQVHLRAERHLNVTVLVNDARVLTRKFDQAAGLALPEFALEEAKLQAGVNHIRITT